MNETASPDRRWSPPLTRGLAHPVWILPPTVTASRRSTWPSALRLMPASATSPAERRLGIPWIRSRRCGTLVITDFWLVALGVDSIMAVAFAAFVEALQQLPLLGPAQREQLAALQQQYREVKALAGELVRRGWLTPFQANQLAAGKAAELVLDQYLLLDRLGQGGMGAVYRARQRSVQRTVALKVIRREALASPVAVERFHREAHAAARLAHPNVITLFDAREANGIPFLVMEYVQGTDLAKLVQGGPLAVDRACEYIRQAALGLQHAHEAGLVHRDVKPSNLMLTPQGVVKVMDLGLARVIGTETGGLTASGAGMGTPDYLAPEQAQDAKHVDIRADIYSLGCSLYHLLAGQVPFPGETLANKIAGHLFREPAALERLRPGVPSQLAAVVRRMMAKKPEKRYATPVEVARALQPWASRGSTELIAPPSALSPPAVLSWPLTATFSDRQSPVPATLSNGVRRGERPVRRRWLVAGAVLGTVVLLGVGLLLGGVGSRSPNGPKAADGSARPSVPSPPGTADPLALDLGDGVTLELVQIKAGTFLMGSSDSDREGKDNEKPQHPVTISKDFLMGKFPVTQEQYQRIMGENPSAFSAKGKERDKIAGLDTRRFPVEMVSWKDAKRFCAKVGALTKRRVELPTEAEWEYACRAGTSTTYYCGEGLTPGVANHGELRLGRTTEVGKYPRNPWGLYDMIGNVRQWCADGQRKYSDDKYTDPAGPESGNRVLRGGTFLITKPESCRSAFRFMSADIGTYMDTGFRVVVRPD